MPTTPAPRDEFEGYDSQLISLIHAGRAEEAVEWYVHHPDERFPLAFNKAAEGVDATGIGPMYLNTKRVLVRFVHDGGVRDPEELHKFGSGVLACLGRHHSYLSWFRDHPVVPMRTSSGMTDKVRRLPLFVTGMDLARVAAPVGDPADDAARAELLAAIRGKARDIGRLHVEVFQAHRRFVFESRKTHGGYVDIARRAILDADGRVVGLRSWRTATDRTARPDKRVISQVRALHLRAVALVVAAALRLGYRLPPGL